MPGGKQVHEAVHRRVQADAIVLVDSSGKTVTAVARELGISSASLRSWCRKAKAEQGEDTPGELSSAEREELKRLRRENREQQQTIEVLRKSARLLREGERESGRERENRGSSRSA
ncbi:transposase [Streptomyces sp. NBC_00457]|uniref:transposase n=1 Tax=Streptomyces sp. NBC_00457 TaxID=2975748 RepID=UPI002E1CFDED